RASWSRSSTGVGSSWRTRTLLAAVAEGRGDDRHADGGHGDLEHQDQQPPVDAESMGDRQAGDRAHDAEQDRQQAADRLAAGDDQPAERADDQSDEDRAEEALSR